MQITVNNEIIINGMEKEHKDLIKDAMTLDNPTYYVMMNMGKSVYATPKEFRYYNEANGDLYLPRGSRQKLLNFLKRHKLEYKWTEELVKIPLKDTLMKEITLREYQKPIINRIIDGKYQEGVIQMGTGTGKTATSLEIIRRLGLTATILVPNNVILSQFVEEAKALFGIDVGILNGETKEIKEITVATFQTLNSRRDLLNEIACQTSILVIDEVQGIVSDTRREILSKFFPTYIFGLTGTAERSDGQDRGIFFLSGDIIEDYQETQLKPLVEVVNTRTLIPVMTNYHEMVDLMVHNVSRNTLITGLVALELLNLRKVLVLTKRIQHYKNMEEQMRPFGGVYYIDSDDPKRNETLMAMKRGELDFNCIFGTTSLLAVGTDIPALDTLIIACDIKSNVLTTQAIGRILRLFEGKQEPKVIDLFDNENPTFRKQFYNRLKLYRAKGWEVKLPF